MEDIRVGQGYDVHELGIGLPLYLCGVGIDSPVGCIAHSDGDVALHALCDAILGALAKGDIGHHFPDKDPAYKGIDSKILLSRVLDMMTEEGWRLGNVDITIALQTPKLAPYINKMRNNLAKILKIKLDQISIKANTNEGLCVTGKGEAIIAYVVVLLKK